MPVSADTLRKLIDAGLTGEALIDVVASIDADMANARSIEPMPSSAALRQRKYRERLGISAAEWLKLSCSIKERDDHTCIYCGISETSMHVDHVLPLIQGGTNDESNLVCACSACNSAKSGRTPEQWRVSWA